jgi:hypothetical protein
MVLLVIVYVFLSCVSRKVFILVLSLLFQGFFGVVMANVRVYPDIDGLVDELYGLGFCSSRNELTNFCVFIVFVSFFRRFEEYDGLTYVEFLSRVNYGSCEEAVLELYRDFKCFVRDGVFSERFARTCNRLSTSSDKNLNMSLNNWISGGD